ncbi:MAG: 3-oxoacyl-ACP reductase [Jatrophihabitans sp.]
MPDRYQKFVNAGAGKAVASRLGLPRPAILRRYQVGDPVLPGPALLRIAGTSSLGTAVAEELAAAGVSVVFEDDGSARYAAVVLDATGVAEVAGLSGVQATLSGVLRRLSSSGRVVVLSTAPGDGDAPPLAATRQALVGVVRSLGKELRAGSTANLVQIATAHPSAVGLQSTLRFLLSGRSAYVDGQVVQLGDGAGHAPDDWQRPLAGAVAMVTGAARGIGAAIARTLSRDGATVICADLPAAGEALATVANRIGGTTLSLDISMANAPRRMADFVTQRFGGVDIVVHNAGITRDKLLANMKPEVWDSVLQVNLDSQLRANDMLLGGVLRSGGRIVSLSSTSGIAGNRGQTNYAASKAGVIGMVRATAPLLSASGGTINAVAPGFIDTDMTRHMPFATREVARRLNSLQQAGLPVDVAETVAWLASSGAGGVTGQVLRVCGQNLVGA